MEHSPEKLDQFLIWHENDEHEKIIEEIEKFPRAEWDYELISLYARALNNCERYREALDILMSVEEEGKNDGLWHFRTGYSLYYLNREEEAAERLQRAVELGDDHKDTHALLQASLEEAEAKRKQAQYNPIVYSEEEFRCVEDHIKQYFGIYESVYHEIASPDIHVDIAVIKPCPEHDYYILVTIGMGARPMNVPNETENPGLERAELMICLPPDWQFDNLEDERWYWPLRWLKIIARLPIEEDSWVGWGHTIPNGRPFAGNTELSTIMLLNPGAFNRRSFECKLPGGGIVNFYQMIPLYEEEVQFKIKNSAEILLDFLDSDSLEYVRIDRENLCKE
jgi:tetratricopeptide (TPR) repeat protein